MKYDIGDENILVLLTHRSLFLSWTLADSSNNLSYRICGSVNVSALQWISKVNVYLLLGLGVPLFVDCSLTQKYNFPLFCASLRNHYLWKINKTYWRYIRNFREQTWKQILIYFLRMHLKKGLTGFISPINTGLCLILKLEISNVTNLIKQSVRLVKNHWTEMGEKAHRPSTSSPTQRRRERLQLEKSTVLGLYTMECRNSPDTSSFRKWTVSIHKALRHATSLSYLNAAWQALTAAFFSGQTQRGSALTWVHSSSQWVIGLRFKLRCV